MRLWIKILVVLVVVLGAVFFKSVSGLSIKYYYSPDCPHCQKTSPYIQQVFNEFPEHNWEFYNVQEVSNPYTSGVPTIIIDEEMIIQGSLDIPKRLKCEVQEMSTKECPTYSSDNCIGNKESWFLI